MLFVPYHFHTSLLGTHYTGLTKLLLELFTQFQHLTTLLLLSWTPLSSKDLVNVDVVHLVRDHLP